MLLAEADHLERALQDVTDVPPEAPIAGRMGEPGRGVWVGRCSNDPISGPAQVSFNNKIRNLLKPCADYIADLRTAGAQLADAAKRYGYTEEEVLDSFASTR